MNSSAPSNASHLRLAETEENCTDTRESPRREGESYALDHLSEQDLGGLGGCGGKGAGRAVGSAKPEPHNEMRYAVGAGVL